MIRFDINVTYQWCTIEDRRLETDKPFNFHE